MALLSRIYAKVQEPLAETVVSADLTAEIERLPSGRCLAENGSLAVYLAKANEIPHGLLEIGRLRELTFRRAGEGVGKTRDLDFFDQYYSHIVLWNRKKQELVGPIAQVIHRKL